MRNLLLSGISVTNFSMNNNFWKVVMGMKHSFYLAHLNLGNQPVKFPALSSHTTIQR